MSAFTDLISTLALTPWALVVMVVLLVVDGFFPLVPGETSVVVLATLGASGHGPHPVMVLVAAVAATMIGDGVAFAIGRTVGPSRWRWMRRPRVARALNWAREAIRRRPALVLISAKFVPYARVAVTMTAGSGGLAIRRYLVISFAAAVLYTGYHVTVAVTVGSLFAADPLLGLAASLGFGVVVAGITEVVRRLVARRRAARSALAESHEQPVG